MKIVLYHFATAKEAWADTAQDLYEKKLNHFAKFEVIPLKPKKISRDDAAFKKAEESKFLLENLSPDDYVVLFDERGKVLNSTDFAKKFEGAINSSKKRIVFIIGGAYGVSDEIRQRAELVVSLSAMTMNHLLAQTVALEQIYRAFTILKKIPYHNA